MRIHCAKNERIKRAYFEYLKEARRQNEVSIDAVAKALSRFEEYSKYRDFNSFHYQQAIAFKIHLAKQKASTSDRPLSKSTLNSTLRHLRQFFFWLAGQPGYRSRLNYTDSEYFNLSEKDTRVANAKRPKAVPTLDQISRTLKLMPNDHELEKRDRALIAFIALTGARDSATASLSLKHIDLEAGCVHQDAREVKTKFSKTFTTTFFPLGKEFELIVKEWVEYLVVEHLWGEDDPLFPATKIGQSTELQFEAQGLDRQHWKTAAPIRRIFKQAFKAAGLPYYNPHSFRDTLVKLGQQRCRTPEEYKAWSQNLGHEQVLTTFTSYGEVSADRQGDIIRSLAEEDDLDNQSTEELLAVLARRMR